MRYNTFLLKIMEELDRQEMFLLGFVEHEDSGDAFILVHDPRLHQPYISWRVYEQEHPEQVCFEHGRYHTSMKRAYAVFAHRAGLNS